MASVQRRLVYPAFEQPGVVDRHSMGTIGGHPNLPAGGQLVANGEVALDRISGAKMNLLVY